RPDEAVGFSAAVRLGQREIGIEGGKPGPGRGHKTGGVTTRLGRGAAYTIARLERDGFTDLAERVRNKEVSARAAAKIVGWRRDKTPLEQIRTLLPKLTAAECAVLCAECAVLADKLH